MKNTPSVLARTKSFFGYLLNHNFCPSVDKYVYWLKQPIGWVACAALSSLMIGMFIGPQGFVLMWSFLALLVVGFAWPWISMRSVSCEITFEENRASEGSETVAILKIRNNCPISIYGLTIEGSFLQEIVDEDDLVAVGLEKVSGWSVSTFKWKLTPKKRGQLPATLPTISTGFPFGIIKCSKELFVQKKVIVWPTSEKLQGKPKTFSSLLGPDEIPDDKPGNDGETIGVREFRQGDSIRHIHWAKTAQSNRMIVKEYQTCSKETVHIVLDLSVDSHLGSGGQSSFEWAIRTTASICKQLDNHSFIIKLECMGLPSSFSNRVTNEKGLTEILDFLAMLPELELLQESSDQQSRDADSKLFRSSNRLKFLVCTDRSALHESVARDVKKIQIACQSFDPNLEIEDHLSDVDDHWSDQPSLVLSSPSTAASELSSGWKSEYNYGT